jgi:hypothetical protein
VLAGILAVLGIAEDVLARGRQAPSQPTSPAVATARQLKLFLDCESCFQDYLRTEITFVDFVRDRTEADVHVLITRASTGAGGSEHTIQFLGQGAFADVSHSLRTVTTSSDPDDVVRRQLATAVRIGVLHYLSRDTLPPGLAVSVRTGTESGRHAVAGDRWRNLVFSVRGSASF